jgi:hypothetical protein
MSNYLDRLVFVDCDLVREALGTAQVSISWGV